MHDEVLKVLVSILCGALFLVFLSWIVASLIKKGNE